MNMDKKIEFLEEYAELSGDEMGEYWELLIRMWRYREIMLADGFREQFEKEIDAQIENIQEYCTIEDGEETITNTFTVRRLEWN